MIELSPIYLLILIVVISLINNKDSSCVSCKLPKKKIIKEKKSIQKKDYVDKQVVDKQVVDKQESVIQPLKNEIVITPLEQEIIRINKSSMEEIYGDNRLKYIDYKVDGDPLTPPIRRYPNNYYPKPPLINITNIQTRGPRGFPDSFSFLGNLYRENDNKLLKLYGRRRDYDLWDYYVIFNSNDSLQTKIDLPTKNYKELYDGDEINVNMFSNGKFKVFLNKQDEFSYSPYVMY